MAAVRGQLRQASGPLSDLSEDDPAGEVGGWAVGGVGCTDGHLAAVPPLSLSLSLARRPDLTEPTTTRLENLDRQLHTAAFAGDVELCTKLCKAKADFNAREPNQGGLTALHLAASSSSQAMPKIEHACR